MLIKAIKKAIRNFVDPVCQNWDATKFGEYRGAVLQLHPMMDPNNPSRICKWVMDPKEVALVDQVLKEYEDKAKAEKEKAEKEKAESEKPQQTAKVPSTGFNPAGGAGL